MKKSDFDALLSSFNMRVSANARQVLLAKDELNQLKNFDLSYFISKSHFDEDGTQNYLVFHTINKYFKVPILIMFHHENLKDYLLKVLNHLQHLIIVLHQH